MQPEISIKSGMEKLVSQSGLLCIGALINSTNIVQRLNNISDIHCINPVFSHSDILISMLGLISIGKPDYDAIEIFRSKPDFYVPALNISGCPSSPTLRQRIDLIGEKANDIIKQESGKMIGLKAPSISPIQTSAGSFAPLDIDVSPFDNSKTQKEGVSKTYKDCDGFSPIFGYLGTEGYLVNAELRQGSQHCQKNTPAFIEQTLVQARQITSQAILMRLDSGNDSRDNFPQKHWQDVHFIIKRNLRRESKMSWLNLAQSSDQSICSQTKNKTTWTGWTTVDIKGEDLPYPIVYEVTQRYYRKGQKLLFPEIEVNTYWCSLPQLTPQEVIELYHDHGTSEQFHSEIKTDLGLERLPSGNFASNSLILHLGLLAYNMLRIIGQISLEEQQRHELPGIRCKQVKRRRIGTVLQDLIYMAGRMIKTGRRWFISFGQMNPFAGLAEQIFHRLKCMHT